MSIYKETPIMRAESGVDLRPCDGCFVKKDASGKLQLAAAADTAPLGCVHVPGDQGQDTDYFLPSYPGIPRVKLHSTPGVVAEGTTLVLAGNGTVKAGTTGTMVAIAQESGEADALIGAILTIPTKLV